MEHIGYQLIDIATGNVIETWGGVSGMCPAYPAYIILPNGDHVHCPEIDADYSGYRLVKIEREIPPTPIAVIARTALSASDTTLLRCLEAGVAVPSEWKAYRDQLRAIIKSGSGDIPVRPAYPEGT